MQGASFLKKNTTIINLYNIPLIFSRQIHQENKETKTKHIAALLGCTPRAQTLFSYYYFILLT